MIVYRLYSVSNNQRAVVLQNSRVVLKIPFERWWSRAVQGASISYSLGCRSILFPASPDQENQKIAEDRWRRCASGRVDLVPLSVILYLPCAFRSVIVCRHLSIERALAREARLLVRPISFVWATLTPHGLFRGRRCATDTSSSSQISFCSILIFVSTPGGCLSLPVVAYSSGIQTGYNGKGNHRTLLTVYPQYVSVSLGGGSQPIHLGLLYPLVARRYSSCSAVPTSWQFPEAKRFDSSCVVRCKKHSPSLALAWLKGMIRFVTGASSVYADE